MNNWQKQKLGDIADVKLSNVDKKTNENERVVRLCNYTDVYKNAFIDAEKAKSFMVASCNENEFEKFILRKGQVAITKDSETRDDIGVSTYIAEDFDDVVLGYHLSLITPYEDKLNGRFLHYWFNSRQAKKYFENNSGGSGQRCTLPLDIIKSIPLILPTPKNQENIASTLSNLDAKIELNHRINAELEAMAKTLYDYWFVQFDFPDENGKPYKSSGGKMIWNDELKREIPDGWETKRFGQICNITRGVTYNKNDILKPFDKNSIPILRATNISNNEIDLNDMVYVPKNLVSDEQILQKFDVLVTMSSGSKAHVGKNAFYFFDEKEISFGAFCSKISFHKDVRFYTFTQLQSEDFKKHISNVCLGTSINNLTNAHITNYKILIPLEKQLTNFEAILGNFYNQIANNLKENQKLAELRDWLLPMLMNGQVTVE